jgi:polar amino acid transport system permease protein
MVPGLGNEFNNMLKTTSLLAFIGVYELFQDAQVAISTSYQPTEIFAAVAVWYLILTSVWTLIQVQIERRLGISDRAESESWLTRIFGISPDHRVNA